MSAKMDHTYAEFKKGELLMTMKTTTTNIAAELQKQIEKIG